RTHTFTFLFLTGLLISSCFFLSCENDIQKISRIMYADTLPVESAKDIEVLYSDSAEVMIWMISPRLDRYAGSEPYTDFPKGVKVVFYDKGLKEKSLLTCNSARIFERTKIMEGRGKVEIVNRQKLEKLNTEHLVWDERKRKIYSNEFVKITTRDRILYGQGFESDQSFDNWSITKPTGSFSIDKEK
ncbi:MAG: LPS export ABC transporter periplasmic protein LptC, partial [Bacteroidetes bacterium]|nr:LPS export ABC transporter periplasmic protein LptC [Bacteroidota bacterium]